MNAVNEKTALRFPVPIGCLRAVAFQAISSNTVALKLQCCTVKGDVVLRTWNV
jgi:hypothetical protein